MNIERVETFLLAHALGEPLGTARRWLSRRSALLVRVVAADGTCGWGECGGCPEVTQAAVRSFLAPRVVSREAMDTGPLFTELLRRSAEYGASGAFLAGLSGLDMALWDLKARLLEVAVTTLLGGRARETVTADLGGLYALRGADGASRLADGARAAVGEGFARCSVKVGLGAERDLAALRAVRRAVGAEVELAGDADGCLTTAEAGALGVHAALEGVTCLEDPLAPEDTCGYATLAAGLRAHGVGLAAGATATSLATWADLAAADQPGALRLDPTTCGGFTGALRLLALADHHQRPVRLTSGCSAVGLAAALALAAGGAHGLTWEAGEHPLRDDLVAGCPRRTGAEVDVPTGTGLGLSVDESHLALYA